MALAAIETVPTDPHLSRIIRVRKVKAVVDAAKRNIQSRVGVVMVPGPALVT